MKLYDSQPFHLCDLLLIFVIMCIKNIYNVIRKSFEILIDFPKWPCLFQLHIQMKYKVSILLLQFRIIWFHQFLLFKAEKLKVSSRSFESPILIKCASLNKKNWICFVNHWKYLLYYMSASIFACNICQGLLVLFFIYLE